MFLPEDIVGIIKPYYNFASKEHRIERSQRTLYKYIKKDVLLKLKKDIKNVFVDNLDDNIFNIELNGKNINLCDSDYNKISESISKNIDIKKVAIEQLNIFNTIVNRIINPDRQIGDYKFYNNMKITTNIPDPYQLLKLIIWDWYYAMPNNCLSYLSKINKYLSEHFIDLLYIFIYNDNNIKYLKKQHEKSNEYMIKYIYNNYSELLNTRFTYTDPVYIVALYNKHIYNSNNPIYKSKYINLSENSNKLKICNMVKDLELYRNLYPKKGLPFPV